MQRKKSAAKAAVPESCQREESDFAEAVADTVPGAVDVRVMELANPGLTATVLQLIPGGSVPPQVIVMAPLKPRKPCVPMESTAGWPAVTVSGLGAAVTAKSAALTTTGADGAALTLFQLASPE